MAGVLTALDPAEVVVLALVVVGLVPIATHYTERSLLFVTAYGCLLLGALMTNLEVLVFGDLFNLVEHGVGLAGSGLVLALAAYVRRQRVVHQKPVGAIQDLLEVLDSSEEG